jgi:hypothetical protein
MTVLERKRNTIMSRYGFTRVMFPAGLLAAAFVCCIILLSGHPAAAATAAGTLISNSASATYTDTNGVTYSTVSNTVVVEVQNAPSLTVTTNNGSSAGTGTGVPNSCLSDVYTLTNTGNGLGHFQLPSAPVFGGSDSGSVATTSYSLSINGGGATTGLTFAALQAALAASPSGLISPGGFVTISIDYCITGAATPGTITTTLTANILYKAADQPNPGGLVDTTSPNANNTYTDTIVADARLDLQKTQAVSGTSGAPVITYTVLANNGGASPARMLTSVQGFGAGAPFTSPGVLIADKIPTPASNGGVALTINGSPTVTTNVANGFPGGASATIVYSNVASGASGWSNSPAGALWIGVYVSGGAVALNAHAGSSAGNVPAAAVTLTFALNGPTGPGAGNACSVTNIANGVVGGNANYLVTQPQVIGPTINTLISDGTPAAVTAINNAINNTTSLQGPSGASQSVCSTMPTLFSVLNGPKGLPGATGSFDGVAAVNNNNDFTAVSFTQAAFTIVNNGTVPGTPNGNSFSAVVSPINVPNQVQNAGNTDDNYKITATAPAGFTVQLFQDSGTCTSPSATPLGGATAGATSVANPVPVNSSVTLCYWAVYSSPNPTQTLKRYDANIVAASNLGGACATCSNTTHNELYSGFVVLTKTIAISNNTCGVFVQPPLPATQFACPAAILTYTVDYRNIMVGGGSGTEPLTAQLLTAAGTFVITEDGTLSVVSGAAPNNWAAFTNGLNAPAVDTTGGTTYVGNTAGSGKFVATVGGAAFQLVPPGVAGTNQGTITFAVTVK